jgi:hypothetical protein
MDCKQTTYERQYLSEGDSKAAGAVVEQLDNSFRAQVEPPNVE